MKNFLCICLVSTLLLFIVACSCNEDSTENSTEESQATEQTVTENSTEESQATKQTVTENSIEESQVTEQTVTENSTEESQATEQTVTENSTAKVSSETMQSTTEMENTTEQVPETMGDMISDTSESSVTEPVEYISCTHKKTICVPETGITYEDAPCNTEGCDITKCADCGMELARAYWCKGHVNIVADFYDIVATCVSKGKFGEHRWCAACNEQMATPKISPINPDWHPNFEYINAKEATCGEAGYLGDCRCIDCGEIITGPQFTYIPPTGNHSGGTAKCGRQAICDVCNQPYGEYGMHGETEIRGAYASTCCNGYTGDTYCLICNEIVDSGVKIDPIREHNLEVVETSKPGYLVWKLSRCTECGTEFTTAIKVS